MIGNILVCNVFVQIESREGGFGFRCYGIVATTLIGVILGGHNALNQAAVMEGEWNLLITL